MIDLQRVIAEWAEHAARTNKAAEEWAADLPDRAGQARTRLEGAVNTQLDVYYTVREMFSEPLSPYGKRKLSAEDILRIYAPEALDLAPAMVDRQRQLKLGIADELERPYRESGQDSVRSYCAELKRSVEGLDDVASALSDFVRTSFPLRVAPPAA